MKKHEILLSLITSTACLSGAWAADPYYAEPGEIVIMREITPQPVFRVQDPDPKGPITNRINLKPNMPMERVLGGPLDTINAISITDEQAAGVRGDRSPGQRIEDILAGDSDSIKGGNLHGAASGRSISRAGDASGRLNQVLGASSGGGAGGASNNAMKGLADALGQAFRPVNR